MFDLSQLNVELFYSIKVILDFFSPHRFNLLYVLHHPLVLNFVVYDSVFDDALLLLAFDLLVVYLNFNIFFLSFKLIFGFTLQMTQFF